jgi:hypothetical protein
VTAPATRMFATCLPGLAPLVRQQLDDLRGITATGDGFDGRADIVLFGAGRGHRDGALALRTTEDVFVEVGRADRAQADDPRRLAAAIWRPQPVQRALSIWAGQHPLAASAPVPGRAPPGRRPRLGSGPAHPGLPAQARDDPPAVAGSSHHARAPARPTLLTAYGARQVRQDLATGGQDVHSHHRRASRPGNDFQAGHAPPSRQEQLQALRCLPRRRCARPPRWGTPARAAGVRVAWRGTLCQV